MDSVKTPQQMMMDSIQKIKAKRDSILRKKIIQDSLKSAKVIDQQKKDKKKIDSTRIFDITKPNDQDIFQE